MAEASLFALFAHHLNEAQLPYMITGSVACMVYGDPRLTLDVDMVVALAPADATRVEAAFPAIDFYCPPPEVIEIEVRRGMRAHFNIIHHESGLKADIYPVGDALQRWALPLRRFIDIDGDRVAFAPPEYVVLKKLEYFREGGSEKHLRDIAGVLRVSAGDVDVDVIADWVARRGLDDAWAKAIATSP